MSKKYGLIVPGKEKPLGSVQPKPDLTKSSVFGSESSDSADDGPPQLGKMRSVTIGPGLTERRQARMLQQKALAEDPTIFQYDELYDDIETKRDQEKKSKTNEIKKPKYINRLLQEAERRKLENERRIERTVQKEREAEGEQFKDKESYVTSGYKKKLEELKQAEEQEKREDYLESIGDVRKQQDLGGFYRHLYEQKLGRNETSVLQQNVDVKLCENPEELSKNENISKKLPIKPRTYRKRHSSDEEETELPIEKDLNIKKAHIQSNLDADSDFSIDSSSDSDEDCDVKNNKTVSIEENKEINDDKKSNKSELVEIKQESVNVTGENDVSNNIADTKNIKIDEKPKNDVKERKPKIDIWKKRTIGDIFDAALQRYFERKTTRNG